MTTSVLGFERAAPPRAVAWSEPARRTLQAALGALDRIVPPHRTAPDNDPPAEWFQYPPV